MKRIGLFFIVVAVLTMAAAPVFAIDGGNPKKGKYLYRKSCKSCHGEGGEGGDLTPMSKTQKQWDRFFDKKKHPGTALDSLDEGKLKDINQFLFDHAADSDQPATCG